MSENSNHLKPLRLFDMGRESGPPVTDDEKEHLRECEECRLIIEVFARQFEKPSRKPFGKPKDGNAA